MTALPVALGAALLFATDAGAQIIKVPSPAETRRPLSASVSIGFLQSQDRFDGHIRGAGVRNWSHRADHRGE